MVDPARIYLWAWDARPFPAFPLQGEIWSDGGNWLLGHWLNGRLEKVTAAGLIAAILADHGIEADAVEGAEGTLSGYVVPGPSTARSAIEPIVDLFGLAVFEEAGELRFSTAGRRAQSPDIIADLAVGDDDATVARVRSGGNELPDEAMLSYRDPLIDYQAGSARAERPGGEGARIEGFDISGMLEAGEAEGLAADWLRRRVLEREQIAFAVPAQARVPEPGTVFRLAGLDADYLATSIEEGLVRRVSGKRILRAPPIPHRVTLPPAPQRLASGQGPALTHFLDLPLGPSDTAPQDQLRVAAFARPWTPQAIYVSPEETGFAPRATIEERATIGELVEAAPTGFEGRIDVQRFLTVKLHGGELSSVSRLQLLNGANAAAIRASNGQWEIVQFETAEEIAASVWRLSGLLRGQLGTDDALTAGAGAGAAFVFLDRAVDPAGLKASEAGLDLVWRTGPAGKDFSGAAFQNQTVEGGVRALTPYSPAHLRVVSSETGDLTIGWVRRGRIDADGWLGPEIPLGEESEAYRVDIAGAGGPVVRSAETAAPSWIYAAGAFAADFPTPPAAIDVSVRQISAQVGPGVARTVRHIFP